MNGNALFNLKYFIYGYMVSDICSTTIQIAR